MKSTLHPGTVYVCTNPQCGRCAEFTASPTLPSPPHRCVCGSVMKKPYSRPSLRVLPKLEAEARLKEATEPLDVF